MRLAELKYNRCPNCNQNWQRGLKTDSHFYTHICGYKLSKEKYRTVMKEIGKKSIESYFIEMELKRSRWR